MKTWYQAACDTHRETCFVFTTSTFHLMDVDDYLDPAVVFAFLDRHWGCNLRIIHRDDQYDAEPHLFDYAGHDEGRGSKRSERPPWMPVSAETKDA